MATGKVMSVEIDGNREIAAALKKYGTDAYLSFAKNLYREGEELIAEAKPITPIDKGTLRNSGYVEDPVLEPTQITVLAGFGGAAQGYAIYVHEDLSKYHNPPTQAKFLEDTLLQRSKGMTERIANRMNAELGK